MRQKGEGRSEGVKEKKSGKLKRGIKEEVRETDKLVSRKQSDK